MKSIQSNNAEIYYSIERLFHFSCVCGQWFSVIDFKPRLYKKLYCPFCGKKFKVKNIELEDK